MFIELTTTYMSRKIIINTDQIKTITDHRDWVRMTLIGMTSDNEPDVLNIEESYEMIRALLRTTKITDK